MTANILTLTAIEDTLMSYGKIAAIGAGVLALAGAGVWMFLSDSEKAPAGKPASPANKVHPNVTKPTTPRETLKGVSITNQPVVTDAVYNLYLRISKALGAGTVKQGDYAPVVEIRPLMGADDPINTLLYHPETLIDSYDRERITVIVDTDGHADAMVMIVTYRDLQFTMLMRDKENFVAAGPLLDDISTMGYLQLLLESVADQWHIPVL